MINDTVKDIIAPCLWGAAVNLLDLEADKFLIIERVLEHGGDRQIEFVLGNFKHFHKMRNVVFVKGEEINNLFL